MSTAPIQQDFAKAPDTAHAGDCAHATAGDQYVDAYLDELLGEMAHAADAPAPVAALAPPPEPPAATPAAAPPVATHEPMQQAPRAIAAARTPIEAAASDPSPARGAYTPLAQAMRWLRVAVDADSYALELLRVQEVVRVAPIVRMRGAARAVLGVMNLRGRIVPVFDLGLWLGAGSVTVSERARVVVVERNDELIGLLVSAVDDVVTLGRERIEPPMPGNAGGLMAVAIVGIARVGATPTVLLDANALFG